MSGDQDNLVLSDSEPEESKLVNQSIEGGSDDDSMFRLQGSSSPAQGRPARSNQRPISSRSARGTATPTSDPFRTATPSSGHFSAGSKISSPSPSGVERGSAGAVRRELDGLRRRQSQEKRVLGSQEDLSRDVQLSLIEEKIREVLAMLRSLNTMNISEEVLAMLRSLNTMNISE